eukprot:GFYU01000551.1.p1 GENE.GFYU01000551.1~~GFYU01000551.1.p1  ORF type:complete len:190 (-),score=62.45 GFYU01000551.1:171-704(-)
MTRQIRQYQVVGRAKPTEAMPVPPIFRMRIFAPSHVIAKSRFWYTLRNQHKLKKASGDILDVNEVFERYPEKVNNYGIWIRYDSRTGTHNIYKEYRDTHLCNAVTRMYAEMAGSHRARFSSIQIIKTGIIKSSDCTKPTTKQFHKVGIKFATPHRVQKLADKKFKTTFKAARPSTWC